MSCDPDLLTCADAEALLPLVADAVLDAESDPALFAHLARCAHCQDALARHDLITLALGAAPQRAPAAVAVIHYRLPPRWIAAAAAVLAVAVLGTAWSLRPPSPSSETLAVREVIRLVDPVTGLERPMLLIRQGDHSTVVDPREFDQMRNEPVTGDARALPVRQRY